MTIDQEYIARTVHQLLSDSSALLEAASGKNSIHLVQAERNDIVIAHSRLGRLLSHLEWMRNKVLEAAE